MIVFHREGRRLWQKASPTVNSSRPRLKEFVVSCWVQPGLKEEPRLKEFEYSLSTSSRLSGLYVCVDDIAKIWKIQKQSNNTQLNPSSPLRFWKVGV